MFQKILLPSDGSRASSEAAHVAAELAVRHGGTVQPIITVEFQYCTGDDIPAEITAAIRERIEARAQRALDEANAILKEAGAPTAGGVVREGPPADEILREARDGEYDLIVMGSRGVSLDQGRDRLVGSVTERVLHATPCPVLVIRAADKP